MRILTLLLFVALGMPLASAEESADAGLEPLDPNRLEQLAREHLDQLRERLQLTDQQQSVVEPLLKEQMGKVAELRNKMRANVNAPRSEFIELREQLGEVQQETLTRLEEVLDPEQMAEYREIQAEWRDQIRRLARERRGAPEGS